jgi:hypothetical protein
MPALSNTQLAAQSAMQPMVPEKISAADAARASDVGSLFSIGEINLTVIIFLFGLTSLLVFYLMVRGQRPSEFHMRVYVILVLVFGTLLVVSSSYATAQIAPVVGFFGTIAGYLLGKTDRPHDPS